MNCWLQCSLSAGQQCTELDMKHFSFTGIFPRTNQVASFRGEWDYFPGAHGCIDGTVHDIYQPDVEPEWQFYSGHKHFHCTSTQVRLHD